LKEIYKVIN